MITVEEMRNRSAVTDINRYTGIVLAEIELRLRELPFNINELCINSFDYIEYCDEVLDKVQEILEQRGFSISINGYTRVWTITWKE